MAGEGPAGWGLVHRGLTYTGGARDATWARLYSLDLQRQEAEDEEHLGVAIDTPERWEAAAILREAEPDPMTPGPMMSVHASRAEALKSNNLAIMVWQAGDLVRALKAQEGEAAASLARGQFYRAARAFSFAATSAAGLGRWDDARRALAESQALANRVGRPVATTLYAQELLDKFLAGDLERLAATSEGLVQALPPALRWALGHLLAMAASASADAGRTEAALAHLGRLLPWLERVPAWSMGVPMVVGNTVEVLWLTERTDHAPLIEAAVREKFLAPDFRSAGVDARLSLARLCALTGRFDEAVSWFAEARRVLDEQGARPLLAMTDYDEALMYVRRDDSGDAQQARPLVEAALQQFEAIGMTGWISRAEELNQSLD
jgi:tetratricopeptide (TPR) repeat protein